MTMRSITRAVRGGAYVFVAGAVLVGLGATADVAHAQTTTTEQSTAGRSASTAPRQPVVVQVKVGTRPAARVATRAKWPIGLLAQQGVSPDRNDYVQVIRDGYRVKKHKNRSLRPGDRVKLNKVTVRLRTHDRKVKPRTVKRYVTSLKPGKRRVVKDGRAGVRRVKVRLTWHNGRLTDRDVRDRRWVKHPRARVVQVGVKERFVPGTQHLNWRALAECESGNNPRAVNPAGYYGLYQFDVGTWHSVGGKGMPHHASRGEQTYRAQKLYAQRGRSPWPNCGRYL